MSSTDISDVNLFATQSLKQPPVIARRVSGKIWKHPKLATRRTQMSKSLRKTWDLRVQERKEREALKLIEKEIKDREEAKRQQRREAILKKKKAQEEKERLEHLAAVYSAKKMKRLKKKLGKRK
ncbi:7056_t:CDS:2 [Paraglomus occultum]|uniref:rRNA-processing protein n=1 Tax=Paraglomus occultum TaxID=144539 RepID=A0A9N9F0V9_9GLOM|nr:7056_t:CDS:2 [Paraglomus occultum]